MSGKRSPNRQSSEGVGKMHLHWRTASAMSCKKQRTSTLVPTYEPQPLVAGQGWVLRSVAAGAAGSTCTASVATSPLPWLLDSSAANPVCALDLHSQLMSSVTMTVNQTGCSVPSALNGTCCSPDLVILVGETGHQSLQQVCRANYMGGSKQQITRTALMTTRGATIKQAGLGSLLCMGNTLPAHLSGS